MRRRGYCKCHPMARCRVSLRRDGNPSRGRGYPQIPDPTGTDTGHGRMFPPVGTYTGKEPHLWAEVRHKILPADMPVTRKYIKAHQKSFSPAQQPNPSPVKQPTRPPHPAPPSPTPHPLSLVWTSPGYPSVRPLPAPPHDTVGSRGRPSHKVTSTDARRTPSHSHRQATHPPPLIRQSVTLLPLHLSRCDGRWRRMAGGRRSGAGRHLRGRNDQWCGR